MRSVYRVLFLSLIAFHAEAQVKEYYPDPAPGIGERLEAWQDLKFGLLMHWGPYSQWGIVESWSICPEDLSWAAGGRKEGIASDYFTYRKRYEELKYTFNPEKFNPEKWAQAAGMAGMKYMVFTTKHHDGFCMFDTKETDYKITASDCLFSSNARSNVTRAIFDAFRKNNFWIGAYFSKPDWHSEYYWWDRFPPSDRNPNYAIVKYPDRWKKFVDYTHAQVNELMSDYGKIDILWLDGGWVRTKTDAEITNALTETYEGSRWARNPQNQDINMPWLVEKAREKQPGLIVVDRAVPGIHQNYLTPEQHIPEKGLPYPWETCMTMATSWSYKPHDDYKTADELVEKFVDVVSKGGNFLLNIAPRPDGELDSVAYQRLNDIGTWTAINREAIYSTRKYESFGEGEDIRFTQSKDGKVIYVFFFKEPLKTVVLKKIPFLKNRKAIMLGSRQTPVLSQSGEGTSISFPKGISSGLQHVWVVKLSDQ